MLGIYNLIDASFPNRSVNLMVAKKTLYNLKVYVFLFFLGLRSSTRNCQFILE